MPNRAKPGSLLREVRIDLKCFERNLLVAKAEGFTAADLSADAYNLGAERLAELVFSCGLEVISVPNGSAEIIYGLNGTDSPIQLVGEVIRAKKGKRGSGVSYGYIHKLETDTNLALVGIGFCDGIPRAASANFQARVNHTDYSGVGRIAMDQCVIDTGKDALEPGTEVEFFSPQFTIANWAKVAGVLPQELLLHIGGRVERVYK